MSCFIESSILCSLRSHSLKIAANVAAMITVKVYTHLLKLKVLRRCYQAQVFIEYALNRVSLSSVRDREDLIVFL